jgi:L-asparaginase
MLILNTGGTFNKRYNPLNGEMEVPFDNAAVETILLHCNEAPEVAGLIYKDSLEMDMDDRKMMARIIMESNQEQFIIIHGTDTMDQTAAFLDEVIEDKQIILTGAMMPFSIDPVEATTNFSMALAFAHASSQKGVFICMHGLIDTHEKIVKNRSLGRFERA